MTYPAVVVGGSRLTLRVDVSCPKCGHAESSLVGGLGNPDAVADTCHKCGATGLTVEMRGAE